MWHSRWNWLAATMANTSLQWSTTESGKKVVFDSEPYAGFWGILGVNLMRVLPIDSML